MHYLVHKIILIVLGASLILLGGRLVQVYLKYYPTEKAKRWRLNVWSVRAVGIAFLVIGVLSPSKNPWPWHTLLSKDENIVALLERGQITEGRVAKVWYQRGAPEGWRMDYEYDANDPATKSVTTYVGSAQGPRRYYANLKPGETITVIYYPRDPRITCEIRQLLNDPTYRFVFNKAGNLHLLDRFRDEYDVEDISFKEWCKQQWQK